MSQLLENFENGKSTLLLQTIACMQLISKHNKAIQFLLHCTEVCNNAWIVPWRDKTDITINNTFQKKIIFKSRHKLKKIWVDKGSKFYNGYKTMAQISTQHLIKENLFFLKDLLEP